MKGLVILLLLPLLLANSTPELVSDSPETAPTCLADTDCFLSGELYNCCIDGICYIRLKCCHGNNECDSNCCIGGECEATSDCKPCSNNSECVKTKCCRDDSCVPKDDNCCVESSKCSSNCCLEGYCVEETSKCESCTMDSDCIRTQCCKDGQCMKWHNCNILLLIILSIAGLLILIAIGVTIFCCKQKCLNN